jgi:hypothetical protein
LSTELSEMGPAQTSNREQAAGAIDTRRLAVLMLSVVVGTCLALDAMANWSPLQAGIREISWRQARWKKLIPLFCTHNHFVDAEDRLLHEQIPSSDFSRGGVYFVGASNITWALKLWDQPAVVRSLIGNFGFPGSNHGDHLDMLRFLVESEGLLEAGRDKTLIVIAADYHMSHEAAVDGRTDRFGSFWTRRGFYTVDADGAIHRSGLNPVLKTMIRERARIAGFLKVVVNIFYVPLKKVRVHNGPSYASAWAVTMKPDWRERISVDLDAFAKTIDYLKTRGARVTVIQMPEGSWEDKAPFEHYYDERMRKICTAADVKVHDFRRLLEDDDFTDSVHLTTDGIEKFQAAVMPICLEHLRSIGALPENHVLTKP